MNWACSKGSGVACEWEGIELDIGVKIYIHLGFSLIFSLIAVDVLL